MIFRIISIIVEMENYSLSNISEIPDENISDLVEVVEPCRELTMSQLFTTLYDEGSLPILKWQSLCNVEVASFQVNELSLIIES